MATSSPRDPNYVPAIQGVDTVSGKAQYISSLSLAANTVFPLTVAVVDTSGNQTTSLGGVQYTDGGVPPVHPIGNTIEWSDGSNWQTVSTAKPLPVTSNLITGFATSTKQSDGSQKTQIVDGSGNVIASTTNALNVNVQNTSLAVTNTGTFAVQATLAAETTKVIGTVNQGTSPWVANATLQTQTDTTMIGGVNIKEINAVTPLMGNGVTGTGSLRVTVASDNTAFSIKNQDGSGNALTTNSTTYTAKFALDSNLLGTLGTAFSTAGKVDVKAADGDVFVRQATGSNLHMVVDSGTVTTVSTVTAVTSITNQVDTNLKQIGGTNTVTGGTSGLLGVGGSVATNVAITDNPLNLGVQAISAENTAVTATRKVQLVADLTGKLITSPHANKENFVSGVATATGTADTAVIAAQGAGNFIYITAISVANTGSTSSLITIETDTASAKTAIWYLINPAGGGDNITFDPPIKGSVSNKNVGFVAGSSSTTQYVSMAGYFGT